MLTTSLVERSPRKAARIAGALYLVIIAGGLFAEAFVRQRVLVAGDPAATARNILEHELLYRLGFATHLFYLACAVVVALILFELLRRVNRTAAALALLFDLAAISIESVNLLNHFAPLHLLSGDALNAFSEAQRQALAYNSLRMFSTGFGISLAMFGFFCLVLGPLIYRSRFLPRGIGVLMTVAGLCYLINSFSLFISPAFSSRLFPFILLPSLIAELSLALWLVVKGLDVRRWEAAEIH